MREAAGTPSSFQVVKAIARREIVLGARRKLVRLLFLASVLPPIILIVSILVRMAAETITGARLNWDPVLTFLQFQALPVALLALGLGTPAVARDRSEDVLFLYSTRPVLPWHYALGKMLAVAVPATGLMLLPGVLITLLRMGVTGQLGGGEALAMVLKLTVASAAVGWAYAGISVGPSALTKRGRWALLIALGCFAVPDVIGEILWGWRAPPLGPKTTVDELLIMLFEGVSFAGILSLLLLIAYGTIGMILTTSRVRREMIP